MSTIKSYTDLEQSKKLAKILPPESADMSWVTCNDGKLKYYQAENRKITLNYEKNHWIPCWSLASLLDVLPTINDEFEPQLHRFLDKYFCTYEGEEGSSCLWKVADNPVDACYEMILKLNELKKL